MLCEVIPRETQCKIGHAYMLGDLPITQSKSPLDSSETRPASVNIGTLSHNSLQDHQLHKVVYILRTYLRQAGTHIAETCSITRCQRSSLCQSHWKMLEGCRGKPPPFASNSKRWWGPSIRDTHKMASFC